MPRDEPDLMPAPAVCPTIQPSHLVLPHQLIGAGARISPQEVAAAAAAVPSGSERGAAVCLARSTAVM